MTGSVRTIAFDADDTLWHNERYFRLSQDRFADLLRDHADPVDLDARLLAAERRNIGHYGYGVKGFTLSMIETAIEVTEGRVPASVISELLAIGQDMLRHPVDPLPHAQEVVTTLTATHHLVLITKGDLLDQERKLAQSGLGDAFHRVEIVSDKTAAVYDRIFRDCPGRAEGSVMVGNSLRSDINPALQAGSWAVHVPHDLVWDLEHDTRPDTHPRFRQVPDLGGLLPLLATL